MTVDRPESDVSARLFIRGGVVTATESPSTPFEMLNIEDGLICIEDGLITSLEPFAGTQVSGGVRVRLLDFKGLLITPGLVDCHTHPAFVGTREREFVMRSSGRSYEEIAARGGGIRSSIDGVRRADEDALVAAILPRLDRFMELGTTTIEAKSGYGLGLESELKSLRALRRCHSLHAIDIVPTFLGAHALPPEFGSDRKTYVDLIVEEMLPRVVEEKLAYFCDVFCEDGYFTLDETRRICRAATELGLGAKIHADQLTHSGATRLACELGAISADHLEHIDAGDVEQLRGSGVVPVLLPGSVFFLGRHRYPPAREMIDQGLDVALSTDFNPGSSMIQSMPFVMSLASLFMGMTPEEGLVASTLHGARAIQREKEIGRLARGLQADLIVWDCSSVDEIPYHCASNLVRTVIKGGRVVWEADDSWNRRQA